MSRTNQKLRTRKDLLEAASRLLARGGTPTLDDVAAEANISRATAYRYFSGLDALLLEASLDIAVPRPDELFGLEDSSDPINRLNRVDSALHDMINAHEPSLRAMLAHSLQRGPKVEGGIPARQNRRTPLIEAALEPARDEYSPEMREMLVAALGLIIGTEAMVVFKDVLRSDDADARRTKAWMIATLVNAARREAKGPARASGSVSLFGIG